MPFRLKTAPKIDWHIKKFLLAFYRYVCSELGAIPSTIVAVPGRARMGGGGGGGGSTVLTFSCVLLERNRLIQRSLYNPAPFVLRALCWIREGAGFQKKS